MEKSVEELGKIVANMYASEVAGVADAMGYDISVAFIQMIEMKLRNAYLDGAIEGGKRVGKMVSEKLSNL
jgi:hypothetical protein